MVVAEVELDDILQILRPIWTTKSETASRVRGRLQAVLDVAKVRKLPTGENLAAWAGNLALILAAHRAGLKRHQPSMPYADVPEFFASLRTRGEIPARALELTILTAARTTEVREARWEEFDLANRLWRIRASRMKMARDHRVPPPRTGLSKSSRASTRIQGSCSLAKSRKRRFRI